MPLSATLILCTRNGGQRMATCLDHIDAIVPEGGFEVILVDNGSDDAASIAIMQDYTAASRHPCTLVIETAPGNGAGRNAGIRLATGDVIVCIDDDCYVDSNIIADWVRVFEANDVGYASGRVLPHNENNAIYGFCRTALTEEHLLPNAFVRPGFLQGSNMAFRKSCLDRIGLFDPRFGSGVPYAGEDWDIALRAAFAGFAGGYFPGPTVSHDHGRSTAEAQARMDYYFFGTGAVFAKHSFGRRGLTVLGRFMHYGLRRAQRHRLALAHGYLDFLFRHSGR